MVKPDVKVNYYAALEVGPDASVDDIKKQYRKLALKYHPDRNPGKEEEFNSKFQAISAAHEILSDPTQKATYDAGRRKANLSGGAPKPAASGRTGNPYAATTQFAPPPRRTQDPTGWNRAGGTGADRFTNFPGPSPTSRADPKRASFQDAWSAMGGGARKQSQKPTSQPPPNVNPQQRRPPPPPVPPRDNTAQPQRPDLPKREADIRAGYKHRQAPTNVPPEQRTAWAHYNDNRAESSPPQRPGFSRTNTASKTPKRNAFDPNTPGSDERPTSGGTTGYSNHYKSDSASAQNFGAARPSQAQQQSYPPSGAWTKPQGGSPEERPQFQPPHRNSTYQHRGGEKVHLNPEQLRRSNSTRDATRLHKGPQSPRPFHTRHRSASPTKYTNGRPKQNGFQVGDDSDTTESPSSASSDADLRESGPFGAHRRPKKIPTPPSIRMNGVSGGGPRSGYQSRRGSQSRQPSRNNSASAQGGQGQNGSMYETLFHLSDSDTDFPLQDSRKRFEEAFGVQRTSTWTASATKTEADPGTPKLHLETLPKGTSEKTPTLIDISPTSFTPQVPSPHSAYHQNIKPLQPSLVTEFVPHDFTAKHNYQDSLGQTADTPTNSFNQTYDFPSNGDAKSRSAENFDTTFSPTSTVPTFAGMPAGHPVSPSASRRSSPPKRPRETLSARPSRTHINTRMTNDPSRAPASPTSAPNPQLFGEVPTTNTPEREATFSPDAWQNSQFFAPQQSGLSRGPSVRRASQSNGAKDATGPRPASVSSAAEGENERDSGSNNSAGSGGDAMDVDPAPPASQSAPPPKTQSNARMYSVPLSNPQWRRSQNMPPPTSIPSSDPSSTTANNGRRRSSARSSTDPSNPLSNLNPLSASLDPPQNAGLSDFSTLSSSVPFQSKSSNVHPAKLFGEGDPSATPKSTSSGARLPAVPVAPPVPQKLTQTSWREYIARFHVYLTAQHNLQKQFLQQSQELAGQEEMVLLKGPAGLDAKDRGGGQGVEALLERAREEERWCQLREVAGGRYREALEGFGRVKRRVWELREGGNFSE
ncbi:DnaJ domain-containing protein 8 [Elsinoe fawcettii]|nr:DnaJ domain-containing protein 8 [Elsinoe fawcettii]